MSILSFQFRKCNSKIFQLSSANDISTSFVLNPATLHIIFIPQRGILVCRWTHVGHISHQWHIRRSCESSQLDTYHFGPACPASNKPAKYNRESDQNVHDHIALLWELVLHILPSKNVITFSGNLPWKQMPRLHPRYRSLSYYSRRLAKF